ncbi:hypothetical protein EMIHUDRAFT_214048 [Emiliania huxleyi CCMP1516]|uniref:Uncharacterized protein n=2 Tax=Emiliania huxleyi TaxID=2903 RepID=A0A0D3ILS4_EMIH1|nr:hypothetical protein EMIHUDRAFT_214048 [Emiliania huxleyi CCMP1516]EOD12209.1 hypothetical protein EMIHUDRAFT_214048 [Emiliania huxleyi CCMP1516]|eukprot:XP_005764638.1 hypothetical protein EMIHUDRAFT_214048 [Emiliania huxleyi CCMP1516]
MAVTVPGAFHSSLAAGCHQLSPAVTSCHQLSPAVVAAVVAAPRRLLVVGAGLTSAAILRPLGYVTVHTSTIGRHLGRLQRLWTTSGTRAGSRIDASASETPAERRTAASLWAIASRLGGRAAVAGLTAACSSGGLAFGVRRGYRASLAIPRMYWARPGRLRPV